MNDGRQSDKLIVPKKRANKDGAASSAECVEGRGLAKENLGEQSRFWTQGQVDLTHALDRIREAARRNGKERFTALWHHVYNVNRLRQAYGALKRDAAPGVDEQTWHEYGEQLGARLKDLSGRLQRGAYRPQPVKRVYIPKGDGRERPIGITCLEDKIVQRATTEVLQAIYEVDFLGFSYGFRPGRNQHRALDAVTVAIESQAVHWVLDADIQGFFDTMDHDWILRFLGHRIGDQRILRHVKKWLKAGVLEEGKRLEVDEGVPQGGSICPLLANIYLHYVLDLWTQKWRNSEARGKVVIVRYADDFIVGFEHRDDAERYHQDLRDRLADFNLKLNEEKTRLLRFGRDEGGHPPDKGEKPGTFNFLGFTHICGRTRRGAFCVLRQTMAKKKRAKLAEITKELRRRMHRPIAETGQWLQSVLRGHYQYYGVPRNSRALGAMHHYVKLIWRKMLRRRSDKKHRITWERIERLANRWLPPPRIVHPYPNQRLRVTIQGRSPVR